MSIEINDDIRAIFYISWPDMDWMAGISEKSGKPEALYRFRRYRDAKAFDSKDTKTWTAVKPREDIDGANVSYMDLIKICDEMIAFSMKTFPGGESYRLIRGEHSLEEFMDMFTQLPFVHTRLVSLEDCKETIHRRDGHVTIALLHKPSGTTASADGPEAEIDAIREKALERLARAYS